MLVELVLQFSALCVLQKRREKKKKKGKAKMALQGAGLDTKNLKYSLFFLFILTYNVWVTSPPSPTPSITTHPFPSISPRTPR
jgi:hypothetical protein